MKLIPDWRLSWRLWSVRLAAIGALLSALAAGAPDALLTAWNALPDEVRMLIPASIGRWLSSALFLLAMIARLVRQAPKEGSDEKKSLWSSISGKVTSKASAAGGLIAAAPIALALALAPLKTDEGKRNVSYLDIAAVPTSCYGHTGPAVRVGERKSDAQCEALLARDAEVHLRGVLARSPQLGERPYQLAAVTRLTFNIGVGAYAGSTIARRFDAGDWRGGCDGFVAWNKARVNGRLVVVRGLALRRERERAQCLSDVR
jgi:lysozyme